MEEKQMTRHAGTTEKLFYQDSFREEFTAVVVSCEACKKGYEVVLDRSAFFPEGGGQFGDIGWLMPQDSVQSRAGADNFAFRTTALASVLDTQEREGVIYHLTDRPVAPGTRVTGRLDFEERFVRMQQHTGEHIVSGVVHRLCGYDNVGFHLGAELTTLDFNGELTAEQVHTVEVLSNQAVFDNMPVEILYPSKAELAALDYRSKIEIEGQVRLVSIPGIDLCACCAPHLHTTGQVGMIKILACERHRGGCRMTMVSGMRALKDYQIKQRSVTEVSVALSAKPEAIGAAVEHQKEQLLQLREQLNSFQASYLAEKLSRITGEEKNVCIFVKDFDAIAVRNFVNDAMERCSGICGAFIGSDADGYRYILGSRNEDTRETAQKLNAAFDGKGGGKPEMVQGSLRAAEEEIRRVLEAE